MVKMSVSRQDQFNRPSGVCRGFEYQWCLIHRINDDGLIGCRIRHYITMGAGESQRENLDFDLHILTCYGMGCSTSFCGRSRPIMPLISPILSSTAAPEKTTAAIAA